MKRSTKNHPTIHQPAYQAKAPCGKNVASKCGKVKERIKLKHHAVAVAQDMPTSRTCRGKLPKVSETAFDSNVLKTHDSAEYVKGTGPSPGE